MRRRPVARTVGRTALIAGTATAVSGRVAARQGAQAQAAQAQAAQAQAAAAPPPAQPPAPAAATAPAANPNAPTSVEQLTALAALREQGVLTDAEFESEKAKILTR